MRVRLDLAYDGTAYKGWARQTNLPSVQQSVEEALQTVLRLDAPPQLTVAGRTDSGVHASGQVAHVDVADDLVVPDNHRAVAASVDSTAELETLARRVNGVLSHDIRIHRVTRAPEGFDARFSALWRRYQYRIADTPEAVNPLRRHDTVTWDKPLDLDKLNAASEDLRGHHDFAAFCRRREGATTIRMLQRLDWHRTDDGVVVATFQADAFCHSMVRAIVGCLLPVGDGRRPVGWPREILAAGQRDSSVEVTRSHGLTLVEVAYPSDEELAVRAAETRRLRLQINDLATKG